MFDTMLKHMIAHLFIAVKFVPSHGIIVIVTARHAELIYAFTDKYISIKIIFMRMI